MFGVRTVSLFAIGLLGCGIFWSSVTRIEASAHAVGRVEPTGKVRIIQNLEGGIINDIYVVEGQNISSGEKILEFEAVASLSEVGELESHIAFLSVEVETISAFLKLKRPAYKQEFIKKYPELVDASVAQMKSKITLRDSKIQKLNSDIAFREDQINANLQMVRKKKEEIAILQKQLNISYGRAKEVNATKLAQKRKLLEYFDQQIDLSADDLESLNANKILEKQKALELLERQIEISKSLLAEKITSELAHLDLLRASREIRADIENLKATEKQRELSLLSLYQNKEITEVEIQDLIEQGVNRDLETLDLERQLNSLDQEVSRLKQTNIEHQNQINSLNSEILVKQSEMNEGLTNLLQKYNDELNKYIKRLDRFADELGRRVVVSPIDGIVKKVNVFTIGGVVKPGMDLVEIVPNREDLVVEADLPVSEVGFVNANQKVVIRLIGSHGSQYEALEGRVSQVSPDTIRKEDGTEFYQVKIITNSDHFVDGLNRYDLRPGLLVDCRFVVLERSLLENLVAPIITTKNKAFSENVWTSRDERSKWLSNFSQIMTAPVGNSG